MTNGHAFLQLNESHTHRRLREISESLGHGPDLESLPREEPPGEGVASDQVHPPPLHVQSPAHVHVLQRVVPARGIGHPLPSEDRSC